MGLSNLLNELRQLMTGALQHQIEIFAMAVAADEVIKEEERAEKGKEILDSPIGREKNQLWTLKLCLLSCWINVK